MKDFFASLKDNKNVVFIIIGGVIILICLIIILYFNFFYKRSSRGDLKNIVRNAAVKYCNDNCDKLFEGVSSITVPASTLIDGNYMKSFVSLTRDKDTSCSGDVVINKSYDGYNYITHVNCDDKDKDIDLYDSIISISPVVTEGAGLYDMNSSKVYRGEYVDNYIKIADTLFRIVKINEDKKILLILADNYKNSSTKWDDRFNSNVNKNDGFNNYSISRAREYLNNLLSNVFVNKNSISLKDKVVEYEYCLGSRDKMDSANDGSIECSSKLNDFISLISAYDFINASLDKNCMDINNSKACQNYNYLTKYDDSFWTVTPEKNTTNKVYYFDGSSLYSDSARNRYSMRFVIAISGNEVYKSGDGSFENPFVIYE